MTLGNDQRAGKGCADAQEIEGQFPWWLREKRRKAVCCCDPVTAFTSHMGQISTSLQAKRSCNSFCTKTYVFVQICTSPASQAKLQGTLQWWSDLQTILSWVAAFIAWAGWVPHVGRGQRTYYTQVSAFAWCCNQIWGRNVAALPPWFLPFSMFILEHFIFCKDSQDIQPRRDEESWSLHIPKQIPKYFVHGEDEAYEWANVPQSTGFSRDSMGQHFRSPKKNWLTVDKDAENFIM